MEKEDLLNFSIKVKNFKCFGEPEQGFDRIKPINLIIGRNNSGKSTLLDLLYYVSSNSPHVKPEQKKNGKDTEIIFESLLKEDEVRKVFRKDQPIIGIIDKNAWEYGKGLVGTKIKWKLVSDKEQSSGFISVSACNQLDPKLDSLEDAHYYQNNLVGTKENPFKNKKFNRLYSERDIKPEDVGNCDVKPNGDRATCIIEWFINDSNQPSELVEKTLLDELNYILKPDANFTRIVVQRIGGGKWEIYLEEEEKGRIPLSESGSGLKTIILVLIYLYLVPAKDNKKLSEYIFAFEELENNMHPALLKRLLSYLYEKYLEHGCIFFLTTHSNVAIDFFSKNKDAQIIHVTHDGEKADCRTVTTYIENCGILDDLGVRASDLLQSNGVIWVEGPSDRIYIKKWIQLWSDGELREGFHYQCVFYGGRLLSHLEASEPEDNKDGIAILNVNRNSIILMDSDKKSEQTKLNDTKKRVIKEIEGNGGIAWVTKGKEIENYIPAEAAAKLLGLPGVEQVGQYDNFFEYLNGVSEDKGKYYNSKKIILAEMICQHLTKENISVLDLAEKLEHICERIRKWND